MSDIKKAILKVAQENPKFAKLLKAELTKTAGGTGWPLTPKPVVVGPRRIKKAIIGSNEFTREYLESLDFKKVEYEKPEKNPYRINGTLVTWRVFPKGSFGDRDSNYVWGYVSTEWRVGPKGIVMEGDVVVKH
jgi:hypothetical protein